MLKFVVDGDHRKKHRRVEDDALEGFGGGVSTLPALGKAKKACAGHDLYIQQGVTFSRYKKIVRNAKTETSNLHDTLSYARGEGLEGLFKCKRGRGGIFRRRRRKCDRVRTLDTFTAWPRVALTRFKHLQVTAEVLRGFKKWKH